MKQRIIIIIVGHLFLENIISRIGSGNVFSKRKHCLCVFVEPVDECVYSCTHLSKWHDLVQHIDRKRIDRKLDGTYLSKVPNISVQIS